MNERRRFLAGLLAAASPASTAQNAPPAPAEFAGPAGRTAGFAVSFHLNPNGSPTGQRTILEIPQVLEVTLHDHDPADRTRQNYPAFPLPGGSVPVLEATLALSSTEHPDWNRMTIGVPLAMLGPLRQTYEVRLVFTGVRWSLYVDGRLADNDFPFGYPDWPRRNAWRLDAAFVTSPSIDFARPLLVPEIALPAIRQIQYWTPPGHNTWVGDVVTAFHRGRYHVFYLYDRRHHQSKFGKGAHYFEHLSTSDFRTWTQHEAATPLEEQWECIGTGTPFVYSGRLCLSYGLHTGRVYPDEKTNWPAQNAYLDKHGVTGSFPRNSASGVPAGSTWATSADGVSHFRKSGIVFHPCQNPSVYIDPEGNLRMLANAGSKGMWASKTLEGGWRCTSPEFPPGGDCTFYFRWGRFDYIIGGFTGLWSKPVDAPDSAYEDQAARGLDFYDGSNVPCITQIAGGSRFLMAAWVPIRGWGGVLLIRELVQLEGGRIGSKCMEEIAPPTGPARPASEKVAGGSFLLTFDVAKPAGRLAVAFLPESGAAPACEFQIDLLRGRAAFAPAASGNSAAPQKTLREGGSPHQARDYAIENLSGTTAPFSVRLIVKGGRKIGGSLIDAEIAGCRTLISYRPDLSVGRVEFRTEGLDSPTSASPISSSNPEGKPMNTRVFYWVITSALAGFLFGFDTIVISGAEQTIQKLWGLSPAVHGVVLGSALYGTVLGSLAGGWPVIALDVKSTLLFVGVLYVISAVGCGFATGP
ncbi:MAG: MFS transporter [Paludibaculum sp.]